MSRLWWTAPWTLLSACLPTGPVVFSPSDVHPQSRRTAEPPSTAAAATTPVRFLLEEVAAADTILTRWRVHAEPGMTLEDVRLSSDRHAPCGRGVAPRYVTADGAARAERPIELAAVRRLALEFSPEEQGQGDFPVLVPGSVVDFVVGEGQDETCLRAALVRREARVEWRSRDPWFVGMGLRGYAPEEPRLDGFALALFLRAGRWLGPLRLGAELGAGASESGKVFVSGATAELSFLRAGRFALSIDAGPDVVLEKRSSGDEPRFDLFFGPRTALHFALTHAREPLPQVSIAQKLASLELEVPVALWWSSRDSGEGPAWVLGLAVASYGWL